MEQIPKRGGVAGLEEAVPALKADHGQRKPPAVDGLGRIAALASYAY
jgi:hypothetical protein